MSRKRLSNYSNFALPFQRSDLDGENITKECCTQYENLTSRDVLTIQVLNVVSIIYGTTFLVYLSKNDNFLHIGTFSSLYIPFVHVILEYAKVQIQKSKKIRFNTIKHENLFVTYLTCTCLCHCIIVLFGAELTTNVEGTFVFSSIITAFVLVPLYFFYDKESLYLLTFQKTASSPLCASVQSVAYGSVIGAWFGAFVIPLDWDRNWQQWPIPCIFGSLVGFVLGHTYSLVSLIR